MASGHRWNTVGDEFVRLLIAEYQTGGEVHWPTVIAAAGCLTGETVLMTHEARMPESGVVDNPRVSEFMHDGEVKTRTIWGYSAAIATQAFNVDPDTLPSYRHVILQLGTQLRPASFPALDVPLHLVPHDTPMNAGPRLRRRLHEIATKDGIHGNDSAFALATAMMKMIGSAQYLGIRDLTSLALQSCVAGSRFAPLIEVIDPRTTGIVESNTPAAVAAPQNGDAPPIPAAAIVAAALSDHAALGFGKRR